MQIAEAPHQRRQPVQARSRETVDRVLLATRELVLEGGVDAATTTAIATRAGVGASSLYRFFSDRDELFARLLEAEIAQIEKTAEAAESSWEVRSIRGYVEHMLEMFLDYHEHNPLFVRLWFGGRVSPAVTAIARAGNVAVAERTRARFLAAGLSDDDVPLEVALIVIEVGDRLLDLAFRAGPRADRRIIAEGAEMLIGYLEQVAARPRR